MTHTRHQTYNSHLPRGPPLVYTEELCPSSSAESWCSRPTTGCVFPLDHVNIACLDLSRMNGVDLTFNWCFIKLFARKRAITIPCVFLGAQEGGGVGAAVITKHKDKKAQAPCSVFAWLTKLSHPR